MAASSSVSSKARICVLHAPAQEGGRLEPQPVVVPRARLERVGGVAPAAPEGAREPQGRRRLQLPLAGSARRAARGAGPGRVEAQAVLELDVGSLDVADLQVADVLLARDGNRPQVDRRERAELRESGPGLRELLGADDLPGPGLDGAADRLLVRAAVRRDADLAQARPRPRVGHEGHADVAARDLEDAAHPRLHPALAPVPRGDLVPVGQVGLDVERLALAQPQLRSALRGRRHAVGQRQSGDERGHPLANGQGDLEPSARRVEAGACRPDAHAQVAEARVGDPRRGRQAGSAVQGVEELPRPRLGQSAQELLPGEPLVALELHVDALAPRPPGDGQHDAGLGARPTDDLGVDLRLVVAGGLELDTCGAGERGRRGLRRGVGRPGVEGPLADLLAWVVSDPRDHHLRPRLHLEHEIDVVLPARGLMLDLLDRGAAEPAPDQLRPHAVGGLGKAQRVVAATNLQLGGSAQLLLGQRELPLEAQGVEPLELRRRLLPLRAAGEDVEAQPVGRLDDLPLFGVLDRTEREPAAAGVPLPDPALLGAVEAGRVEHREVPADPRADLEALRRVPLVEQHRLVARNVDEERLADALLERAAEGGGAAPRPRSRPPGTPPPWRSGR